MRKTLPFPPLRAALAAMLCLASPVLAVASDARGDFLPSFTGTPADDLDIGAGTVIIDTSHLQFGAVMFDRIGLTPDISLVWGIDRGAGTPGLFTGTPPVGPGVTFDAVVVLRANGSGQVIAFNDGAPPTVTALSDPQADVFGSVAFAFVPFDLLPSRGAALRDYRYNLWTRSGGGNALIADLLQDKGTFLAEGVPEPATWAMLVGGFGMVGAAMRRRQVRAPSRPAETGS
ncbi:PEPxxWA-CTERM sorting domain-containing protein [Sandaracinobacteroides saxicola]|uniref:PEPxxWA-CTERM sorting domain-containing protein n=1 Tax=Sandaracinobacteroides saxicola TaxID=2759707 RepID=UPI001FB0E5DA|nr:PEPxxWA-CTERM sorting domain-containing protein [Sandaracinobacteroides saxicola]